MLIVNFSFFHLVRKVSYYICNVQENSQYFTSLGKKNTFTMDFLDLWLSQH